MKIDQTPERKIRIESSGYLLSASSSFCIQQLFSINGSVNQPIDPQENYLVTQQTGVDASLVLKSPDA